MEGHFNRNRDSSEWVILGMFEPSVAKAARTHLDSSRFTLRKAFP